MERQRLLAASVIAARSLRTNIRRVSGPDGRPGTVLTAGPHQLASVWTRDFCFAVGGLLAAGEVRTVRFTLDEIIRRQREDGLFPRLLDSHHPAMRLVRALTGGLIPLRGPLKPNFRSEHFVAAVDSNSLLAWAAVRYALHTGNFAWAGLVLPRLLRGMSYYDSLEEDGLVVQPPYSDWKDTIGARRGAVFFTQLLRWKALNSLAELYHALGRAITAEELKSRSRDMARRTHRAFWSPEKGFFRDTLDHPKFSSEGNLAAIAWGFADEEESSRIIRTMDKAGLITPWGPCAGERYPTATKTGLACLAGIKGYHDEYVWLWNSALLLDSLRRLGRRLSVRKLADSLAALLIDSGRVSEVYHPETGREIRTWLFRSERPFSWSAAMLLEVFEKLASENVEERETAGEGKR